MISPRPGSAADKLAKAAGSFTSRPGVRRHTKTGLRARKGAGMSTNRQGKRVASRGRQGKRVASTGRQGKRVASTNRQGKDVPSKPVGKQGPSFSLRGYRDRRRRPGSSSSLFPGASTWHLISLAVIGGSYWLCHRTQSPVHAPTGEYTLADGSILNI